jgi:hypothetical protein
MSSFSDFLCGAIIQEYQKLFTVEFSDTMFRAIVYYTDVRTALRNNNYSLRTLDDGGFSLWRTDGKNKEPFAEMHMGPFSAPFLNAWVISVVDGLTLFPVGFDRSNPRDMQGKLAEFSAQYDEESSARNVTSQQADAGAVDIFMSNEVVNTGTNKIFKVDPSYVKKAPRSDFDATGEVVFYNEPEDDDDSEDEEEATAPACSVESEPTKNPVPEGAQAVVPAPFYYVITMEKRNVQLDRLPKIWRAKLKAEGLSWEFEDGLLYVSNTKGASYGFPPAPHHLSGLPVLSLSLDSWNNVAVPNVEPVGAVAGAARPAQAELTGDSEWEKIVIQFFENPCMGTFLNIKEADVVKRAFLKHKFDHGYRMGSNHKPMQKAIRDLVMGEEMAKPWSEFAQIVVDTVRPADTKGLMLVMYKLRLNIVQDKEGRVYSLCD